jgi:hypothetical protein
MTEFQSLHDWQEIDKQLRSSIWTLYNLQHKRQIEKMYKNLVKSVTKLSQKDVDRRRHGRCTVYNEQLVQVQQDLHELQSWLLFATLLDEKPKE